MAKRFNIFIGCGGMGVETIGKIEQKINTEEKERCIFAAVDFPGTNEMATLNENVKKIFKLNVQNTKGTIERRLEKPEFSMWWPTPNNKPYIPGEDIDNSTRASQIRANGRLAFYENIAYFQKLFQNIQNEINDILNEREKSHQYYYIISSLGGGTGSGLLIDLISYIRFHINEGTDKIFGVFYDPTVLEHIIAEESTRMAMGALVEINHWMNDPQSYRMDYPAFTINLKNKNKWLNGLYLVQKNTVQEKYFISHGEEKARDQYINLVANAFSRSEAINQFLENVGKRMDTLQPIAGKISNIIGFGYSHIMVPTNEIVKYFEANLLLKDKFFQQLGKVDLPDDILLNGNDGSSDGISLKADGLSEYLKEFGSWNNVRNDKLSNINLSLNKQDLKTGINVDDRLFRKFEISVQENLKQIKHTLFNRIDNIISDNLPTLNIKEVMKWLTAQIEVFEFENRKIKDTLFADNNAEITPDKRIDIKFSNINNVINSIKKDVNFLNNPTNEFKRALTAVATGFDEYFNMKIQKSIIQIASPFYRAIIEDLNNKKNSLEKFDLAQMNVLQKYTKIINVNDFTQSEINSSPILNTNRLELREYILELKIGISKQYLNDKYVIISNDILEKLGSNIYQMIKEGDITNPQIVPIADLYHAPVTEEIETYLSEIIAANISPFIRDKVEEEITINDAFQEYLKIAHNDFMKIMKSKLTKEQVKSRYINDFGGSQNFELLFEQEYIDNFIRWKKLAQQILINRFLLFVEPFWSPDKVEHDTYVEGLGVIDKGQKYGNKKYMIIPESFKLEKMDYDEHEPDIIVTDKFNDRVTFFEVDMGCPLYAFKNLEYIYNDYRKAEKICMNSGKTYPAHNDRRFWTDWDPGNDFFTKPENEEYLLRLYLLSLGFEIITRKNKWFLLGDKRIKNTWPTFRKQFFADTDLQLTVKKLVSENIMKHYYSTNSVDDIFIKGYETHKSYQTVSVFAEEFNKFTKLLGISYVKDDEKVTFTQYGIVPKSKHEIEMMIGEFKV